LHTLIESDNLQASNAFRNAQVELEVGIQHLKRDMEVRWWSTYDMLTRALEQKRAIEQFCSTFVGAPSINQNDWMIYRDLQKTLVHCSELTKLFEGETYGTLPIVASAIEGLYDHLGQLLHGDLIGEAGKSFARELRADLRTRAPFWGNVLHIPEIYLVAAMLDPRQKSLSFLTSEAAKARAHEAFKRYYADLFEDVVGDGELSDAMEFQYMDDAVVDSEVSRYLSHPQLIDDGKDGVDPIPIRWWRYVRGQFPNIYKMACVFWGAPATTRRQILCGMILEVASKRRMVQRSFSFNHFTMFLVIKPINSD
jgi:hypothetical protein